MAYEFFYKYLFPLLQDTEFSFLRVFQYITFRSVYAAVSALIICLVVGPYIIRYLKKKKAKQPIREDGPKAHMSKSGTPTMGGLLIIGVIVITTIFWSRLDFPYVLLLLFVSLAFGLVGFFDDYKKLLFKSSKGLSGTGKFFLQLIVAFICIVFISEFTLAEIIESFPRYIKVFIQEGNTLSFDMLTFYAKGPIFPIYVPFVDSFVVDIAKHYFYLKLPFYASPIFIPYAYFVFGIFVIMSASNAVNLTDGLDGLAIGLVIFVGIAFSILSYVSGNANITEYLNIVFIKQAGELTVFSAAFVGTCIGFLWYNSHPAQIFMGDTGSLALGGIMGTMAVILKKEFLLIIIGGVFVVEVLSVIIQVFYYKWTKKRVFKMAPIHHHFELSGWHESKVIIRFWIIGLALALMGLSTLKLQ